jgi:hypothetical protein
MPSFSTNGGARREPAAVREQRFLRAFCSLSVALYALRLRVKQHISRVQGGAQPRSALRRAASAHGRRIRGAPRVCSALLAYSGCGCCRPARKPRTVSKRHQVAHRIW